MSEEKNGLEPLEIKLTENQLQSIVRAGVEKTMGFKLCQLRNDFNVDEGEMAVSIRVCGGVLGIACQCDLAQSAKPVEKYDTPLLRDDVHREDDF